MQEVLIVGVFYLCIIGMLFGVASLIVIPIRQKLGLPWDKKEINRWSIILTIILLIVFCFINHFWRFN